MSDPFPATEGKLAPHWRALMADLAPRLDQRAAKVHLGPTYVSSQIVTSFTGEAVRRAGRHRGNPMPIVPFQRICSGWEAWLGYRETWTAIAGAKSFTFASSDLTIFLATIESETFHQILRAEWAGPTKNEHDGWSFKPDDAGHPHWQIDVTETMQKDLEFEAARELLRSSAPKEFCASDQEVAPVPPWYRIDRMHFASAVRPWVDGFKAHGPANLASVRAWVVKTVDLLNIELARL